MLITADLNSLDFVNMCEIVKFSKDELSNECWLYFNVTLPSEGLEKKEREKFQYKFANCTSLQRHFGLNVNWHDCCEHNVNLIFLVNDLISFS